MGIYRVVREDRKKSVTVLKLQPDYLPKEEEREMPRSVEPGVHDGARVIAIIPQDSLITYHDNEGIRRIADVKTASPEIIIDAVMD